jgi:hypothetical protein
MKRNRQLIPSSIAAPIRTKPGPGFIIRADLMAGLAMYPPARVPTAPSDSPRGVRSPPNYHNALVNKHGHGRVNLTQTSRPSNAVPIVGQARKNHREIKKHAAPSIRSVSCAVASAAEKRSKASGRAVAAIPITVVARLRAPGRLRRNGERTVGGRRRDGSEGGVKREGTGAGGIIMGRRSGDAAGVGLALAIHEKLSAGGARFASMHSEDVVRG